jgi:hypothetical protein
MVKVTSTGPLVVLVNVPLILPVPLAAMPVAVALLSLTQLNTVPGTVPVITMVVMAVAEQMVCDTGAGVAFGVGFTVMVKLLGVPTQLTPPLVKVGVTVTVPVIGAVPVLVAVKVGNELPAPLPPKPMVILLLVQV